MPDTRDAAPEPVDAALGWVESRLGGDRIAVPRPWLQPPARRAEGSGHSSREHPICQKD